MISICKICKKEYKGIVGLHTHVTVSHKISIEEYYNVTCKCDGCDVLINPVKREYCKDHANESRRQWAKNNPEKLFGGNPANRKGKTNPAQSERVKKMNPMDRLTQEEKDAHRDKRRKTILSKTYKRLCEEVASKSGVTLITKFEDYTGIQCRIELQCNSCNEIYERRQASIGYCPICHDFGSSTGEVEVSDFVSSMNLKVVKRDRTTLGGTELDILIPSSKLAIEFNGLYWHSGESITEDYHQKKVNDCKKKGIRLLHVFEDDWRNKNEIVKSLIEEALGKCPNTVSAKDCTLIQLTPKRALGFFRANNIVGVNREEIDAAYGLTIDDVLVCCILLKTEQDHVEIKGMASKLHYYVNGGLSMLLDECKDHCVKEGKNKIIAHIHDSHEDGTPYESCGFSFESKTDIEYWYTDFKQRYDRYVYRAKEGLTEAQVTSQASVVRIYGCSSSKYILNLL